MVRLPGSLDGHPDGGGPLSGKLVENVMHFARTLRAAGMPVGPGRVIEAVRALETAGIGRREDFYWTLHAVFVNRRDQRELFDQAFHIFWRNPQLLERMMGMLLPQIEQMPQEDKGPETLRRIAEAFAPKAGKGEHREDALEKVEFDMRLTFSDQEKLQKMDFEAMSTEEVALAKSAIARLALPLQKVRTRRYARARSGPRIDMPATLRASLRSGGDLIPLRAKAPVFRPPPLVVLCDVSGSMTQYSRLFLHFMHALTNDRDRVHTFTFGTRLTNVTRFLRAKDVDAALTRVADEVKDWSGGTRIGATLAEFNRFWSRRVLGQGAVVLLITDGLDREGGQGLAREAERLHKSCRRLIWLNPLLRFDGFEPKSLGIRALLPHVDEFRPVHNLESLGELAKALSAPVDRTRDPFHLYGAVA
jgi:uncharacterized protein with von Willebrand factor type A (vWA) domain